MNSDRVNGRFAASEIEIEEFLCGDASDAISSRLKALMLSSPEFAAHVRGREAEREAFYAKHPRLVAGEHQDAQPTRTNRFWTWFFAGSGALVAAAALLFLVIRIEGDTRQSNEIRSRGGIKAALVVRRDGRMFAHSEGVLLRRGDQVRLTVESPKAGYLALLGRDDKNRASVYYDSIAIGSGTTTVPGSLVLDDFVGEEQWFVIYSEEEISVDSIMQVLRSGGQPDLLMPNTQITVLHLSKEETW